jgi:hypothetical protein
VAAVAVMVALVVMVAVAVMAVVVSIGLVVRVWLAVLNTYRGARCFCQYFLWQLKTSSRFVQNMETGVSL